MDRENWYHSQHNSNVFINLNWQIASYFSLIYLVQKYFNSEYASTSDVVLSFARAIFGLRLSWFLLNGKRNINLEKHIPDKSLWKWRYFWSRTWYIWNIIKWYENILRLVYGDKGIKGFNLPTFSDWLTIFFEVYSHCIF